MKQNETENRVLTRLNSARQEPFQEGSHLPKLARRSRRSLLSSFSLISLLLQTTTVLAAGEPVSPADSLNSRLLGRYVAAINAHDTTQFPELFTQDYLQRSGRSGSGLAAQIVNMNRFFTAFPDLHLQIEDRIFDGDRIVARSTWTGTHRAVFAGIAPTGRRISFTSIDIWRVEEGKLAEHWDQDDLTAVIEQLKN